MTTAQQNCRTQCDNLKGRTETLEELTGTNTNDITALEQRTHQTEVDIDALQQMPPPKIVLEGTTLNITTQ